jgi:CelD/BcsL family acetyltransferase involved in cellulose biosynthesis
MAAGLKEFDFLPGDLSYKREWSNKVRHVVDVEAFNPFSGLALVFRLVRGIKRRFCPAKPIVCSEVKGARP